MLKLKETVNSLSDYQIPDTRWSNHDNQVERSSRTCLRTQGENIVGVFYHPTMKLLNFPGIFPEMKDTQPDNEIV